MTGVATHATELVRRFAAPVEAVYTAWTDPAQMREWMAPEGIAVKRLDAVVRPGGEFVLVMDTPDGDATAVGTYREVVPGQRLVFTWRWRENTAMPDSLVEVSFAEADGGTEVRLSHTGFVTVKEADDHRDGWGSCLNRLEKLVA